MLYMRYYLREGYILWLCSLGFAVYIIFKAMQGPWIVYEMYSPDTLFILFLNLLIVVLKMKIYANYYKNI